MTEHQTLSEANTAETLYGKTGLLHNMGNCNMAACKVLTTINANFILKTHFTNYSWLNQEKM